MSFRPTFTDPRRAREACVGWASASGLPIADEVWELSGTFLPELAGYCELVSGPAGLPVGFMTRGEDESFTRRAADVMRRWQISASQIERFVGQASFFEHKRAFLKLEWSPGPPGRVEHLVAHYHRRRPSVEVMRRRYHEAGVAAAPLERLGTLADLLGKTTIHFVAGALRPGTDPHHKLYFSQYATPETRDAGARRLAQVLSLFEIEDKAARAHLDLHARVLPRSEACTYFVSMRFTDRALLPEVKIDYPQVPPSLLTASAAPSEADMLLRTSTALCASAGIRTLSFVGVALAPRAPTRFKLYADLPTASTWSPEEDEPGMGRSRRPPYAAR